MRRSISMHFSRIGLALLAIAAAAQLQASSEFVPCKNSYSPQQQIELGEKAKAQVYKQMPVLPDSSPVTRYIDALGHRIAANAPGYKWPYNFHVANVAEINAFALPGGTVFVNLGTIQAADSEAQLAGVMAHEISHVVLQHSVCNAEKQQRVGLFAGLGQIAAGVLLGGSAGELAQEGIGLSAGLGFLRMSRAAERQADLEGVGIVYDSGFDPHGMPQFFQIIESKYGKGSAQFLSDHPNPGNRTEYLDKEITSYPPKPNYTTTSPEFQRAKRGVVGMHAYTAKEISSGAWKGQNPNLTVGDGVNQAAATAAPDLDTSGDWKTVRGDGFSLDVPEKWQVYGSQASRMIGPPGGITRSTAGGAGNVVYGVLTDVYKPRAGVSGAAAVDALTNEISSDNPGFKPGVQQPFRANGASGRSVECDNSAANGGKGEHDWVIAFPQQDGTLRYFVFVSPTSDFENLRPAFQRMARSLNLGR